MKLSRFSVHRPVFTIMVTLIVILLGVVSLKRLPIDLMPDISFPTLSVSTSYENAGPEEIEELLTRPIEEAMSAVPGVEEVTSISMEGSSSVRISFTWGTDLSEAANDIRERIDRILPRLPEDAERPRLRKFDLASFPVLILGASSRLDPVQMTKLIEDRVKDRIERLPGVAALDIRGGRDREIHVNLYWDKIKALGLPVDQVLQRIRAGNVNIPAGSINRGIHDVTIRTPGKYTSLTELGNTVIAERDGAPILLNEIAEIEDSWRRVTRMVRVNGEPGLRLSVQKQSGTNTVEVAQRVQRELERIVADIPQLHIIPIIDSSEYIQRSIANLGRSAIFGGGLAILVLLLFLRSVRSTLVIALAIPISVVATFGLMYFCGFTLNLMSLGGLALGVGMLVDSAIVVLENIHRLRLTGADPTDAAVNGSEEVTAAIIASTLTTLVVFLPMVFVRGISGVMFKQMAIIISFALFCSLIVALTVVPMLAARILPRRDAAGGAKPSSSSWFEAQYKGLLQAALNHPAVTLFLAILLVAGSIAMIPLVGVELMPASDEGEVRVYADMEVGTRLDVFNLRMKRVEQIVRDNVPEAKNMVARIGASHWRGGGAHSGQVRVALVAQAERTRSSEEIAGALRSKLTNIPGVRIRTRAGQGLFIFRMLSAGSERLEVEVRGHDLVVADALAQRVVEVVQNTAGVTDARASRESGSPEELIIVDRRKAAALKLTVSRVAELLQTILSGSRASEFRQAGDEYRILVKLKDAEKRELRDILDLTVTNADGQPVVLRNVVDVRPRRGPVMIERKNQQRIIQISANFAGRDLGSIVADLNEGLRGVPVPRDFSIGIAGDYEEQQEAFIELRLSLILALVLVYMVMACLYESLRDPFVVMFAVPMAIIGVVLMLFLTKTTFNLQSYIGCIMLGGIVVNNAILLVDHSNLLRRRDGMPKRQAVEEAGRRRLRPILMTASTTSLALIPLALGLGEGGEAQAPLARAVIGGLLSSALITLLVVPVIYSLVEGSAGRTSDAAANPTDGSTA